MSADYESMWNELVELLSGEVDDAKARSVVRGMSQGDLVILATSYLGLMAVCTQSGNSKWVRALREVYLQVAAEYNNHPEEWNTLGTEVKHG